MDQASTEDGEEHLEPSDLDAPLATVETTDGASSDQPEPIEAESVQSDPLDEQTEGSNCGEDITDDDDHVVIIQDRRLSDSSAPREPSPPPRDLPDRFLASDVFTEPPQEVPAASEDPDPEEDPSRTKSRSLSYHQHGASSAGPSRISRRAVANAHAGATTPQRRQEPLVASPTPHRTSATASPVSVHSPVTRSQCVYHVLDMPGPSSSRIHYAIPYCSLADAEAIKKEGGEVLGVASPEENEKRRPIVGKEAVDLDEAQDQALTRVVSLFAPPSSRLSSNRLTLLRSFFLQVGIDLVKEGHCFFIEEIANSRPAEGFAAASDSSHEEAGEDDMEVETTPRSSKRKRPDGEEKEDESTVLESDPDAASTGPSSSGPAHVDNSDQASPKRPKLDSDGALAPPRRRWSFWPFSR